MTLSRSCHQLSMLLDCQGAGQGYGGAPDHYQEFDRGGDRLGKPVLATGNVHYIEPEEEIYREIIVRSLGQGL